MRKNIISLGVAVSLVILGATAGIIYRNTVQLVETAAWVAHTHEILEEIGSTLALLTDAEMARRGYIITGEERQLGLYDAAIKAIDKKVRDLRKLTSDNPDQQRRLNALEPLITQKLVVLDQSIQLWKNKPSDAEAQVFLTDVRLRLTEDIRGITAEMIGEANALLKHRDEESKANTQKAILTFFIGNFLSLTLLALVFYRLSPEITERKRVQEAISFERGDTFLPDTVTLLPSHQLPPVRIIIEPPASNKNITLLGEMGDLLRTCRTLEEAYNGMAQYLQKLFPTESGALCVLTASQNLVEIIAVWGDNRPDEHVFSPDDCWALRRGKLHEVESHRAGLICLHVKQPLSVSFLCVPLIAQDGLLGVLHLINNGPHELHLPEEANLKEHLAVTVANHIALVLSNLRLRKILRGRPPRDPHLLPPVSQQSDLAPYLTLSYEYSTMTARGPRMELKAKTALVTGSAKRVGKTIALALAKRGADLVINYQRSQKEAEETACEIERLGVRALTVRANVSVANEVQAMIRQVVHHFGRLDVLVNNAAIFYPTPFDRLTEKDWDELININLKGSFLCAKYAADEMLKLGGGKIINIADWSGVRPYVDYLPYCVSKAGVIALTKALAVTLAPTIQVNCIAPGPVMLPEDLGEKERAEVLAKTPLKRTGSPEDIASTVKFLIEGSDFITGAMITVDGGRLIA